MISETHIDELLETNSRDISKLERMIKNTYSVNLIRYTYCRLKNMEPEITNEFFMEVDALTTSVVVSYGRLFTESHGVTVIKRDSVPNNLRDIHDEIMSLRHNRYAHHGDHDSIKVNMNFLPSEAGILVNPQLDIVFCVGAPKHWEPLFEWLSGFMFDETHRLTNILTEKSGVNWSMERRDAPEWL